VGVFVWFSDKWNTHSCFLLYLSGKCFDLFKIFSLCLRVIRHSIEVKIKYSLLLLTRKHFIKCLSSIVKPITSQTCKHDVRITSSVANTHWKFCVNLRIFHGDIIENVSGCFYSKHSIHDFSMAFQDFPWPLFSMTIQAWNMVFLNSMTFQAQWSPWQRQNAIIATNQFSHWLAPLGPTCCYLQSYLLHKPINRMYLLACHLLRDWTLPSGHTPMGVPLTLQARNNSQLIPCGKDGYYSVLPVQGINAAWTVEHWNLSYHWTVFSLESSTSNQQKGKFCVIIYQTLPV